MGLGLVWPDQSAPLPSCHSLLRPATMDVRSAMPHAPHMSLDFRELRVYRASFKLGVWAGVFARALTDRVDQRLGDQIVRSARSVPANIAEAWRKRMYPAHFASKITDAEAEAAETQVWLEFAYYDGLIDSRLYTSHVQAYDKIISQLVNLRRTHNAKHTTPADQETGSQKRKQTQLAANLPRHKQLIRAEPAPNAKSTSQAKRAD